jgi:hypothetical protein
MPFLHFAKFLKSFSKKEMIHIKVIFNKTKIAEYTFFDSKIGVKKVLPKIKNNRIYSISLLYKEYGDYVESEISEYILFKYNDHVYLCEPFHKKDYCYLRDINDICISGSATKKIIVEELSHRKIFGLEIMGQNEENILFTKDWMILTYHNQKFPLAKVLKKEIEPKYKFEILDMETDEDVKMDEELQMDSGKSINRIRMVLNINKEKSLYERIIYKIKNVSC